jgi:hypothetical protein
MTWCLQGESENAAFYQPREPDLRSFRVCHADEEIDTVRLAGRIAPVMT